MDKTAKFIDIDAFRLNVRTLNFAGFVVGMGNVVSNERRFAGKCTFAGHF